MSTIAVVKIGPRVRDERVKRFWTQERLASAAGISQKALSKIENDEVEPRFSTILKLAEALGIHPRPAEMLLTGCAALGLLEKTDGRYRNAPMSEAYLVRGKPH